MGRVVRSGISVADGNFSRIIAWLQGLPLSPALFDQPVTSRILRHAATDEQFSQLIECVVSLAVRSPMHRDAAVRTAEHFRGNIDPKERNALIGLNIRHSLRSAMKWIGVRGKALAVSSPKESSSSVMDSSTT